MGKPIVLYSLISGYENKTDVNFIKKEEGNIKIIILVFKC